MWQLDSTNRIHIALSDYLYNENQKLKKNLSTFKQNLIDLTGIINRIANEIDDF